MSNLLIRTMHRTQYYQASPISRNRAYSGISFKLVFPPACGIPRHVDLEITNRRAGHLCFYWSIGRTMGMKKALLFGLEEELGEKGGPIQKNGPLVWFCTTERLSLSPRMGFIRLHTWI